MMKTASGIPAASASADKRRYSSGVNRTMTQCLRFSLAFIRGLPGPLLLMSCIVN
jgi:hypothetical protein